jgi:uncharacterized phiE125 gp8 family phage protein
MLTWIMIFANVTSSLVLGTPSFEPVAADELSIHSHIDSPDGQELLTQYLAAARAWVENEVKSALTTRTATLYLDCFPDWEVEIRMPPLASVTSVVYLDSAGDSQTLSSSLYRSDTTSKPARITPAYGEIWPVTYDVTNAVTITATVGYTASAVPECAKQAIRFMAGLMFEHREPTDADLYVVRRILDPIRWDGSV